MKSYKLHRTLSNKLILNLLLLVLISILSVIFFACSGLDLKTADEAKVYEISIDKTTFKNQFLYGEALPQNIKIFVTYTDQTKLVLNVSNDMISGFDTLSLGDKILTIKYGNKETKVNYTVVEPTRISDVTFKTESFETEYTVGEEYKGIVLNIVYYDGTTRAIEIGKDVVGEFDTSVSGKFEIKFDYLGYTLELNILITGEFVQDNFKLSYDDINDTYSVLEYLGTGPNVIFPSSVMGKKIGYIKQGILGEIFHTISELSIPFIGESLTNLQRINYLLSNRVYKNIKSKITLTFYPGYMTEIPEFYFYDCEYFNKIILPEGLITIKSSAFENTFVSTIVLPSTLERIEQIAFRKSRMLKYLKIPSSVKYIGYQALYTNDYEADFRSCLFVEIPENYKSIQFDYIESPETQYLEFFLTANGIIIPDSVYVDAITNGFNNPMLNCYNSNDISIIDDSYIIYNDTKLVAYIGSDTDIVIPDNIREIGDHAFYLFTIKNIVIPNSVKILGKSIFYETFLETISILSEDIKIGQYFYDGNIVILNSADVNEINIDAFQHNTINAIIVPDIALDNYKTKFKNQSNKIYSYSYYLENDFIIEDDVLKLYLKNDANVTIPASVKKIEASAFKYKHNLVSIVVPDNSPLTEIGNYAFYYCDNLESVTFGENVKLLKIGNQSFLGCESLKTIITPYTIQQIGHNAFFGCINLESINMMAKYDIDIKYDKENIIQLGNNLYTNILWNDYAEIPVVSIEMLADTLKKQYNVGEKFQDDAYMIVTYSNGYEVKINVLEKMLTNIDFTYPSKSHKITITFDDFIYSYYVEVIEPS
ncbi:MAG: leucine-rich repeat domain-containing protein [Christensenellaceae bacterium]|nr:leucine-rich repeat domain-containing protein [Christensenellaceae bacterium]